MGDAPPPPPDDFSDKNQNFLRHLPLFKSLEAKYSASTCISKILQNGPGLLGRVARPPPSICQRSVGVGCEWSSHVVGRSVGSLFCFPITMMHVLPLLPLCRAIAAAATACRLPSSLRSTQQWLVGVSHGFLIAGNRERHMAFLL